MLETDWRQDAGCWMLDEEFVHSWQKIVCYFFISRRSTKVNEDPRRKVMHSILRLCVLAVNKTQVKSTKSLLLPSRQDEIFPIDF